MQFAALDQRTTTAAPNDPPQGNAARGVERVGDTQPTKPAPPKEVHRWALLIGVNNYTYAHELHYCVSDAKELQKALLKYGGYDEKHMVVLLDEAKEMDRMPTGGTFTTSCSRFVKTRRPGIQSWWPSPVTGNSTRRVEPI